MPAYQCLSSLVGSECEGRRRGMARIVGRQRVKLVREAEEDREKKESSFFFSETSPGLLCTSSKTKLATFGFFSLNYLSWDWKRNVEYTVHILSLKNALDGEFQTVERRKARVRLLWRPYFSVSLPPSCSIGQPKPWRQPHKYMGKLLKRQSRNYSYFLLRFVHLSIFFFGSIKRRVCEQKNKFFQKNDQVWMDPLSLSSSSSPYPRPSSYLPHWYQTVSLSLLPRPRNQRRGIHPQHCRGKQQLYWYRR